MVAILNEMNQLENELEGVKKQARFLKAEMKPDTYKRLSESILAELQKANLAPSLAQDFLNHLGQIYRLERKHQKY